MSDYSVSPEKLQDLNVIVGEQGGVIPTEVSNALADLGVALSGYEGVMEDPAVKKSYNKAVSSNKKNGKAWSSVQTWHDDVKSSVPVEPPPVVTPPPVQPSGAWVPIGPALYQGPPKPVNSGNWSVQMVKGNYYTYQPVGDADNSSYSAPNGFCLIGVGNAPGEVLNPPGPQAGGMDMSGSVASKNGQWITMWLSDGDDVRNALYSSNKYAS